MYRSSAPTARVETRWAVVEYDAPRRATQSTHGIQSEVKPVSERTVTIEINQQQEQMLDRLIAEGEYGSTHGEVIRSGFARFCDAHPEVLSGEGAAEDE